MLDNGTTAPDFTLNGVHEGARDSYDLYQTLDDGRRVLLLFYPADFSPVCTNELCGIRDAEWLTLDDDIAVWAVSGDTTYAHKAFAEMYRLNFPLLTDKDGSVSERYDALYEEWEGNARVPMRSVYLVDTDRSIRYAWQTADAYLEPDFSPVLDALGQLESLGVPAGTADCDLDVAYDDRPRTRTGYRVEHLS